MEEELMHRILALQKREPVGGEPLMTRSAAMVVVIQQSTSIREDTIGKDYVDKRCAELRDEVFPRIFREVR